MTATDSLGALPAAVEPVATGPFAVLAGIAPGRARWRPAGTRTFDLVEEGRALLRSVPATDIERRRMLLRLNMPHALLVVLLGRGACATCGVPWLAETPAPCESCSDARGYLVVEDMREEAGG